VIKKILGLTILVFLITSCDLFLSFLVSPVYNIPVFRAAWTVDNARIVGDPAYFSNSDTQGVEWQLGWTAGPNLLIQNNNNDFSYLTPLSGMPLDIKKLDKVESPLFYLELLFGYDFPGGLDITNPAPPVPPSQSINLGRDGGSEINADYTMTVNTLLAQPSYNMPEPAYLGIDGSGFKTTLTGNLNVVNFNISANHSFVTGQATCVFSDTNPAGLLYMVYYHSNGLVSLLYAYDVATTEVGNLFPNGRYEYIWNVYKNN
jgi:hypothetical protein